MEIAVTKIPTNKTEDIEIKNVHDNRKASNKSKTAMRTGSKTGEKEESNSKKTINK